MPLTYESIATYTTPDNNVSSYTFSSIPQTYTDLRLICLGNFTGGNDGYKVTVAGETSYQGQYVRFDAATGVPTVGTSTGTTNIVFTGDDGSGSDAQFLWVDFFNYTQNNRQSYLSKLASGRYSLTSAPAMYAQMAVNNNTAINGVTAITITNVNGKKFAVNTNFTLYALKAA